METNADQLDVVRLRPRAINKSIHVRPDIFMDAELPYVQEEDAPGTSAYRDAIAKLLDGQTIQSDLHEKLIAERRPRRPAGPRAGAQDPARGSLLFGLHPPQLQVLGRRRRRAPPLQDGSPARHPGRAARSSAPARSTRPAPQQEQQAPPSGSEPGAPPPQPRIRR